MKSKILLFSLLSLLFFSCKSDDEISGKSQIPENEKYLDEITGQDLPVKLTYTADKKVASVDFTSVMSFLFTYDGNQIETMQYIRNDGPDLLYRFYYENNRISSFSINDYKIEMVWNPSERSYSFKSDTKDVITIILNDNEDLDKVYHYAFESDVTKATNYYYEDSRKGAMTNTNNVSVYMAIASYYRINGIYVGALSKKPVKKITFHDLTFTFENAYDSQQFVVQSNMASSGSTSAPILFNYKQL